MLIKVTGSHWVNGSGWSYTEDLDSMEINSMDEIKEAAKQYAAEFARNYGELGKAENYQLRFYAPDDEAQQNPLAKIWLSESATGFPAEEITTTKEIFEMMIEDWLADHPEEYDDLQIDEPEFDEELGKWTATACDEKATYILVDEDGNIGIYYSGSRR